MDYIICNKNTAIRIVDGKIVTCSRKDAQRFDSGKAKNVLGNLPKTMKKFHFKIESVPEISPGNPDPEPTTVPAEESPPKVITNEFYSLPSQVSRWVEKVKTYNGLIQEASERKEVLLADLSNIDKRKANIEHEIEFIHKPNACAGYKLFRQLKDTMEERRAIKDEILIVDVILTSKVENLTGEYMDKTVEGLQHRKYTYR